MAKKQNPWSKYIILLVIAVLLLLVVSIKNRRYQPNVSRVFDVNVEDVNAFTVSKDTVSVTLLKADTTWVFAEPDTGTVKDYRIENFFKNVWSCKLQNWIYN